MHVTTLVLLSMIIANKIIAFEFNIPCALQPYIFHYLLQLSIREQQKFLRVELIQVRTRQISREKM